MAFFDDIRQAGMVDPQLLKLNPVAFNLNNVAEYYFLHSPREKWDFEKDFPCSLSPMELAWFEYTPPLASNNEGQIIHFRREEVFQKCGVMTYQMRLNEKIQAEIQSGTHQHLGDLFITRPLLMQGKTPPMIGLYPENARPAKFFQLSSCYVQYMGVLQQVGVLSEYLDESGQVIDATRRFSINNGGQMSQSQKESSVHLFQQIQCVVMLGCSFLHCKNVKRVENNPNEKLQKARARKGKPPLIKYYTLEINPMKEVLRKEGRIETEGLKRALHICRGHFSTYTEEKPLFGKIAGTVWVPSHVRGSKEAGEIKKDYRVKV